MTADASPLLHKLRDIAATTAESVGREVLERRRNGFTFTTKSTTTDVVTEIDTWAEGAIVEQISALRPDDGFIGEEGASSSGTSGVVWTIDPVDGTTNLLYDIPGYNVSIGVAVDGTAVAGAVFDPVRSELFSAAVGHGATRNGEAIRPSEARDLAIALVGTGFSYNAEERRHQALALATILPAVRDIRRLGGAALDLCAVACGRLDCYFERGLSPWDSAAGAVIAAEAGAVVTVGGLTIASAPGIADALALLLSEAGV